MDVRPLREGAATACSVLGGGRGRKERGTSWPERLARAAPSPQNSATGHRRHPVNGRRLDPGGAGERTGESLRTDEECELLCWVNRWPWDWPDCASTPSARSCPRRAS